MAHVYHKGGNKVMARVYAYVMFSTALILFFHAINFPIGAESVSNLVGLSTGDITTSPFWNTLFSATGGLLLLGIGSGIIVGFIVGIQRENLIMIPFITGPLAIMAGTFVRMIVNFNDGTYPLWGASMLLILFGTLTAGYTLSMAEWFRGNI